MCYCALKALPTSCRLFLTHILTSLYVLGKFWEFYCTASSPFFKEKSLSYYVLRKKKKQLRELLFYCVCFFFFFCMINWISRKKKICMCVCVYLLVRFYRKGPETLKKKKGNWTIKMSLRNLKRK